MHLANKINESLDKIADRLIGSVNSATHCKIVQDAFRQYGAKVQVVVDDNVSDNMIVVMGEYLPWRTRQNIGVLLTYSPGSKRIPITEKVWKTLKFDLSQVLQHELIHRRQCEHIAIPKEDWEDHSCKVYATKAKIPAKREAQEYLGSTEEIEAHAHCIMMELRRWTSKTDPLTLLRTPRKIRPKQSVTLREYLETFDYNMSHPAIKRLFKKTVYWIENQEA